MKKKIQHFQREFKEWDKKTPVFLECSGDRYFYSPEDLLEYCIEEEIHPEKLELLLCDVVEPPVLHPYYFLEGCIPEDNDGGYIHDRIYEAADKFNQVVKEHLKQTWVPNKYRTSANFLVPQFEEEIAKHGEGV